jgi:hypothetical protein
MAQLDAAPTVLGCPNGCLFARSVGLSRYREDGPQHIAAYVLAEIPSIFI